MTISISRKNDLKQVINALSNAITQLSPQGLKYFKALH
jgi:hypothetical protein